MGVGSSPVGDTTSGLLQDSALRVSPTSVLSISLFNSLGCKSLTWGELEKPTKSRSSVSSPLAIVLETIGVVAELVTEVARA